MHWHFLLLFQRRRRHLLHLFCLVLLVLLLLLHAQSISIGFIRLQSQGWERGLARQEAQGVLRGERTNHSSMCLRRVVTTVNIGSTYTIGAIWVGTYLHRFFIEADIDGLELLQLCVHTYIIIYCYSEPFLVLHSTLPSVWHESENPQHTHERATHQAWLVGWLGA